MAINSAFFVQSLNDHVQYLRKVTNTLKGIDDFHGNTCTQCKLGQWLYQDGRGNLEACTPDGSHLFGLLEDRHKRFHDFSNEVLAQHRSGDAVGSYRAMTEMHKLSNEMVSLLLKADRHASAAVAA